MYFLIDGWFAGRSGMTFGQYSRDLCAGNGTRICRLQGEHVGPRVKLVLPTYKSCVQIIELSLALSLFFTEQTKISPSIYNTVLRKRTICHCLLCTNQIDNLGLSHSTSFLSESALSAPLLLSYWISHLVFQCLQQIRNLVFLSKSREIWGILYY